MNAIPFEPNDVVSHPEKGLGVLFSAHRDLSLVSFSGRQPHLLWTKELTRICSLEEAVGAFQLLRDLPATAACHR